MKKIFAVFVVLLFCGVCFAGAGPYPNKQFGQDLGKDGRSYNDLYLSDQIIFEGNTSDAYETTFDVTEPTADRTITFQDGSGTVAFTSDVSTAATAWNAITDSVADTTIDMSTFTQLFTTSAVSGDMFTVRGVGNFADISVMKIESLTGNPTDGTVLEVVAHDANVDPLVVSSSAQAGVLTVGQAGNVAIIGATGITGDVSVTGGLATTGATALGNGTSTVAVNSSVWDVSSAGAFSGVASIAMTGDISFATAKGIKPSTTTAQTMAVQSYDVDAASYVNSILLTNGDTPAVALGSSVETVAVDSTTWDVSTAGVFSGVTGLTFAAGEAATVSLASDGAADDLTISVTGANDSSLVLQSAGTGTDAVKVASSAGGITMTSTAVASAWTHTATGAADDLTLSVAGNQDASLILTSAGSGTDALTVSTTANAGDIVISSNDKIDMDSTGTFALNAAGDTLLIQVDSDGAADDLTIKVDGDDDSSIILDSDGTGADAVKIGATNAAGGIDVDAGTNGIDVLATGGAVTIGSTKNAASSIALTANGGADETIVVTNTQGTGAGAVTLTATAGGITQTVAAGKAITLNGTTNLKVGSNVASPAGGELDLGDGNYFYITGTNNITSIAAADATDGRMIVLRFADVLTFTDGNNLKLAGNLSTTADDTITLICDGTNCYEMARSVN